MTEVTCSFIHEVWGPHEGCREFMSEPDTFPCSQPATTTTVAYSHDGQDGEVSLIHCCPDHAIDLPTDEPWWRSLAFLSPPAPAVAVMFSGDEPLAVYGPEFAVRHLNKFVRDFPTFRFEIVSA